MTEKTNLRWQQADPASKPIKFGKRMKGEMKRIFVKPLVAPPGKLVLM